MLHDPWIAPKLRHDAYEPGFIDDPAISYFGAYDGGTLLGLFFTLRISPWEVEAHAALRRPAVTHSHTLGHLFLDVLWGGPDLLRVTAPVMSTLPSAANWLAKLGFVLEGGRACSFRKGGVVGDTWMFGMLRDDKNCGSVGSAE